MTSRMHFFRYGSLIALLVLAVSAMGVVGTTDRANAFNLYAAGVQDVPSLPKQSDAHANTKAPIAPMSASFASCCACDGVTTRSGHRPQSAHKIIARFTPHVFSDLLDIPPPDAPPRT